MILTTHYMEEASYLCDRIVILDQGKVLAKGTLSELIAQHGSMEVINFSLIQVIDTDQIPSDDGVDRIHFDPNTLRGEIMVKDLVKYLPGFLKYIQNSGLTLTSLECRKMTREDLGMAMTGRHLDE